MLSSGVERPKINIMEIISNEEEIMKVCDLNADNLNNLKRICKCFLKEQS